MLTTVVLAGGADARIGRCIRECKSAGALSIVVVTHDVEDLAQVPADLRDDVSHIQVAWNDSFADLRNAAIALLADRWILFVDSDEWPMSSLASDDLGLAELDTSRVYAPTIIEDGAGYVMSGTPRLLHSSSPSRYMGRVHEYCREGPDRDAPDIRPLPLPLTLGHDGYDPEVNDLEAKGLRNVRLARRELVEFPGDPRVMYFLLRDGLPQLDAIEALSLVDQAFARSSNAFHANGEPAGWYLARSLPLVVEVALREDRGDICDSVVRRMLAGVNVADGEYYRAALLMLRGLAREDDLRRIMLFRQQMQACSTASLTSDGRHLDAAIVGLLVMLRGEEHARRYRRECMPWTDGFFENSWPRRA